MKVHFLKEIKVAENRVASTPAGVEPMKANGNLTLPYAIKIANKGWKQSAPSDHGIKTVLYIVDGKVTYKGVADAFALEYTPVKEVLQ
jgi:alanine dehydrogenase